MRKVRGMTLVEMIIAIVLMGIAMAAFTSFLIPQVRDSAIPHYQTRAAALAQGFMSQILARGFDENSDFDGGLIRCGETALGADECSPNLGADGSESNPASFNDVDDYIGCWYTSDDTKNSCDRDKYNEDQLYPLSNALGDRIEDDYKNFRVEVNVQYVEPNGTPVDDPVSDGVTAYKRVTMTIYAGRAQPMTLSAIRGNY